MKYSIVSLGEEPIHRFGDLVELCERLGYDGLVASDTKWTRDTFVRLATASLRSSRLQLNLMTGDPYTRHPALFAQATATVAELSRGRLRVGLASGSHFETMPGYESRRPISAIRETADLLRRMWRGEQVRVFGRVVEYDGGQLDFRIDEGHIPEIWVASRGPQILALAGEIGDGVLIGSFSTPAGIRYAMSNVERGLERSGRTRPDLTVASWLYVSFLKRSSDEVPENIRRGISHGIWSSRRIMPHVLSQLEIDVPGALLDYLADGPRDWAPETMAHLRSLIPDAVVDALSIVGTPAEVADRFRALAAAGVEEFFLWPTLRDDQQLEEFVAQFYTEVVVATRGAPDRGAYQLIA